MNADIGLQVRDLRDASGMSQVNMGKLLGIAQAAVWQIETGARPLKVTELVALSDHFGFSIDAWIRGDTSAVPLAASVERASRLIRECAAALAAISFGGDHA